MRLIAGLILSLAFTAVSPAQATLDAGSLAHFQSGGGWRTTFYLFNTGAADADVQLNFYKDSGDPVVIPLRLPQLGVTAPPAAAFNDTLKPGTVLAIESDSTDTTGVTGWTKLHASSTNVTGYLIFRYAGENGSGVQEGVVTAETRTGKSYVLGFDNTNSHFAAVGLANTTNQAVDVTATARDGLTGAVLGQPATIHLPAMGHSADQLSNYLPSTVAASGTVEFATPSAGQITVLGLRFTLPSLAFTSTPPILKQ